MFYIQKKPISTNDKKSENNVNTTKIDSKKKYIKSPLNYIGGKYRLLSQILPLFPENIDTFVDVFSGGVNVGINVNAKKYIFNDMNSRIIEMFKYFQSHSPVDLVKEVEQRIEKWNLSKTNEQAFLNFRKY